MPCPYLRECLQSLYAKDAPAHAFEIILIDDGSADGMGVVRLLGSLIYREEDEPRWDSETSDYVCARGGMESCFGIAFVRYELSAYFRETVPKGVIADV
jgi:hypothetical protein